MGAGSPANKGEALAMHRVACFAGKPAPTGLHRPTTTANRREIPRTSWL
ncbi:diguanylate cyclase [Pseudomonas mosselii]|nr:diguanylate cyclase [Pseudomonas mosselii]